MVRGGIDAERDDERLARMGARGLDETVDTAEPDLVARPGRAAVEIRRPEPPSANPRKCGNHPSPDRRGRTP